MNIKLNNKLIKTAVAALALVTTSATVVPTTVTNLTTASAKAKKHHKKVKKTKKSKKKAYGIANYYNEFKSGYSYTYNKKKGFSLVIKWRNTNLQLLTLMSQKLNKLLALTMYLK